MTNQNEKKCVEARTLKGFRDVLPAEALVKTQMLDTIRRVFLSFGYVPIETPHLEYTDVLIGEAGEEIGKQLFRFADQGGRDVCLRFDLTVPFARFVVQHRNELGIPFKRFAIGSAFRGERPQLGRFREFTQCDFDFVGTTSVSADAEIVQVIIALLRKLGIEKFVVRINNRKIMNGLAAAMGVADRTADILRVIDKIDKVGAAEVKQMLLAELSLKTEVADRLLQFTELTSEYSGKEVIERSRTFMDLNAELSAGLDQLAELTDILAGVGLPADKYRLDYRIARGLGYYTGIVYETLLHDLPEIGSVCSGGRYDNLTMNFSNEPLPGVGASVGLDRLITALQNLELVELQVTPARVLMTVMDQKELAYVHKKAAELRNAAINVEVYPEPAKLKKQFQYADRQGHPFVAVIGADEIAKGAVTLKDMKKGTQETVADIDALVKKLKQ